MQAVATIIKLVTKQKKAHRILELLVRAHLLETRKDSYWFKFIRFVAVAVGSSLAESTGFTPVEMVYGSTPALPVDYLLGLFKVPEAQEFILDASHSLAWQSHKLPRPRSRRIFLLTASVITLSLMLETRCFFQLLTSIWVAVKS